jgi:hypothetical protein
MMDDMAVHFGRRLFVLIVHGIAALVAFKVYTQHEFEMHAARLIRLFKSSILNFQMGNTSKRDRTIFDLALPGRISNMKYLIWAMLRSCH